MEWLSRRVLNHNSTSSGGMLRQKLMDPATFLLVLPVALTLVLLALDGAARYDVAR